MIFALRCADKVAARVHVFYLYRFTGFPFDIHSMHRGQIVKFTFDCTANTRSRSQFIIAYFRIDIDYVCGFRSSVCVCGRARARVDGAVCFGVDIYFVVDLSANSFANRICLLVPFLSFLLLVAVFISESVMQFHSRLN